MTQKTYVALAQLRFGDDVIRPGEVVPHIPGRDYTRLVELGQITEQVVVGSAPAPAFPEGADVLFIPTEGGPLRVKVAEQRPLPEEVTEQLTEGEQALWVEILDITADLIADGYSADPFVVSARQLVDNDVAERLLEQLSKSQQQDATRITALEKQLGKVQNELASARQELEHSKNAAAEELAQARSELEAAQARSLLPDDALARLEAVSGISDKLAKKALDALTAPTGPGQVGASPEAEG